MRKIYIPLLLAAVSVEASIGIFYNQAGYDAGGPATVVVRSDDDIEGAEWLLMKATSATDLSGSSVKEGVFGAGAMPDKWSINGKYYIVELPTSLQEGYYYLSTTGGKPRSEVVPTNSGAFPVASKNLADKTLGLVLKYFRLDRSPATAHTKVYVGTGNGSTKDVHGGWSDASGDYGTYLSHLSYANYMNPQQIPLTVWALAFANERIPAAVKTATSDAEFAIDEALWGADFLVRMQNDAGFFYMTVFNQWGQSSYWRLCAFSGSEGEMSNNYQTAYREGGGMAIAALAKASTLGKGGDYTSDEYLAAAKKGFEHLESKQTLGGTCAYCDDGKENIIDDYTALFAAMELYAATKDSKYWTVAQNRASHLIGRLSDDGYFWSDNDKERPFFHASDAGLPLVALVRYLELETNVEKAMAVRAAVKKHLDWMLQVTNISENKFGYARQTVRTGGTIKTGYFIPHDNETGYWFQGESARQGSLASAAVYASRMIGYADSAKAFLYAANQLDWILGKNPYGVCMMKGVGTKNPPVYQDYGSSTYAGGIANGITGSNMDGSGIAWDNVSAISSDLRSLGQSTMDWQTWRFEEQWIPHATWYLMALATRYDENPVAGAAKPASSSSQGGNSSSSSGSGENIDSSNSGGNGSSGSGEGSKTDGNSSGSKDKGDKNSDGLFQVASAAGFTVVKSGNALQVTFASPARRNFRLMDVHGRVVMNAVLSDAVNTVQLSSVPKGVYLVHVQGFAPKKIAVK